MSRTDKDLPYWIADEYREVHHWRCMVGRAECSLPKFNDLQNFRRYTACYWQPIHKAEKNKWWAWQPAPPKWYLDDVWNNTKRRQVRDTARKAVSDYRANSDTEIELPKEQHRHCGQWLWW